MVDPGRGRSEQHVLKVTLVLAMVQTQNLWFETKDLDRAEQQRFKAVIGHHQECAGAVLYTYIGFYYG